MIVGWTKRSVFTFDILMVGTLLCSFARPTDRPEIIYCKINISIAAISAVAGIVNTQVIKILHIINQCVPQTLCEIPTPAIDPVRECVVETGMPKFVAVKMTIAAPVSAQHPRNGFNFVIL